MALWLKYKTKKSVDEYLMRSRVDSREISTEWHLGEPIPDGIDRVVNFQADGDELNLFLNAMAASRGECGDIVYTKMGGFGHAPTPVRESLGTCARLQNPHKYMRSCQNWRSVADGSMPPPGLVHEDGRGVCDKDRGYRHKKILNLRELAGDMRTYTCHWPGCKNRATARLEDSRLPYCAEHNMMVEHNRNTLTFEMLPQGKKLPQSAIDERFRD